VTQPRGRTPVNLSKSKDVILSLVWPANPDKDNDSDSNQDEHLSLLAVYDPLLYWLSNLLDPLRNRHSPLLPFETHLLPHFISTSASRLPRRFHRLCRSITISLPEAVRGEEMLSILGEQ